MQKPVSTFPFPKGKKLKALVVGGGWCGLYALKYFLEEGFDVKLVEMTETIGGIWVYRQDKPGGVAKGTCSSTSKIYLHASDYPMPKGGPHFPHHSYVLNYLHGYVHHFKLNPYINLHHRVEKARKKGDTWKVSIKNLQTDETTIERFDILASCVGLVGKPVIPIDNPNFSGFTGEWMHADHYKYPTKEMEGKRVLIVGGGESASDTATEVCEVTQHGETYLSIRNGQWFHDRTVGAYQPADVVCTKHQRDWGFSDYQGWMIWLGRYLMIEFMWGKGGSGIKEWQPKSEYFHGFVNKSRDVVDKVAMGKVKPRREVVKTEGKTIWFKDEPQPAEIDLIIFCTGYRPNIPFLKYGGAAMSPKESYKYVFYPDDPTLCFLGGARPFIGGIPPLAEIVARWAASVYAGRSQLPDRETMHQIIKADKERHRKIFPEDDDSRPTLVNHWEYSDQISEMFGAKPNQLKWFFRNPVRWFKIVSAPWVGHLYRVEDPKTREEAFKHIDSTFEDNSYHFAFNGFNIVMLLMDIGVALMVLATLYMFLRWTVSFVV